MEQRALAAVNWLLDSSEPAIRLMTRRDVLGRGAAGMLAWSWPVPR
jgi:hypothetical protein